MLKMCNSAEQGWQQVHEMLSSHAWASRQLPVPMSLTVYHYCVNKAFKGAQSLLLAQELFAQFSTKLEAQARAAWHFSTLEEACLMAWLSEQFAADGLTDKRAQAQLADLDQVLMLKSRRLNYQDVAARADFFQIMRYFGLRAANAQASKSLQLLLSRCPALPAPLDHPLPNAGEQWLLGLTGGLAAELLLLIKLCDSNQPHNIEDIKQHVREGLRRVLALRRTVDFLENKYSIFPCYMPGDSSNGVFSSELSWCCGDAGQALMLYKAHELLEDAELAKVAELVGLNTLLRNSINSTEIASSPFNRGAAGLAYLYRKLYQASGQEAYLQGYHFWLDKMQGWLRLELMTEFYQNREDDLLHGLVGVGLVLLSAMTETELGWDAIIL